MKPESQATLVRHELPFLFEEQFDHPDIEAMEIVTRHALGVAISMIAERGEGHVGATTSAMHLMAAIYFHRHLERMKSPGIRHTLATCESHKPHAIPGWHGLLYLEGVLTREQMRQYRTFNGPNAYPTHLEPGIQIPTGSLGLGPSAATGLAYLNQYLRDHFPSAQSDPPQLQISIIGDSEFDEGILAEAIKERATHAVKGWVDVIDYNRQSLDGNLDENLVARLTDTYQSNGHKVMVLKYGAKLRALFSKSGGSRLRSRIDALSTADYHALLRLDGARIRRALSLEDSVFEKHLLRCQSGGTLLKPLLRSAPVDTQLDDLLQPLSDTGVKEAVANLGGHDLSMLLAALSEAQRIGGGVAIIAYTVKGWGVGSIIGSLSGHWQKPTPTELAELQQYAAPGRDSVWVRPSPKAPDGILLQEIRKARTPSARPTPPPPYDVSWYDGPRIEGAEMISTQAMAGRQLSWLSSLMEEHPLQPFSQHLVTMSADVAFSAGLKDWLNRRRVWGPESLAKATERFGEFPEMNTEPVSRGQHIRLSNVEQFMGILNSAFGKSGDFTRETVFPFAFFYDIFLERFVEMFKYAAFWDARCWFVGTISGLSSPPESGLHHSVISGMVGHVTPNVVMWEPAFPQEVTWIFAEEFRLAVARQDEGRRVRYLRTSALPARGDALLTQLRNGAGSDMPDHALLAAAREGCLSGGYRLCDASGRPGAQIGKNVITLVTSGLMIPEVLQAAELLAAEGIRANIVCVSCPRLLEEALGESAGLKAFPPCEREGRVPLVTITDAHPSCLSGIVAGLAKDREPPRFCHLGVSRFDRSGTREQLVDWHGLDPGSISSSAAQLLA